MLNFNQLPTFLAVAECRSISRAADRLHLSQPAVSGQIADLERTLGQQLFDRLPRKGVTLTSAGEAFHRRASDAVAMIQDAERAVHDLEHLHTGQLHIGASSTTGTYLLPRLCGIFRRRHPRVALSLGIANSRSIIAQVRDRQIDLGIVEEEVRGDDFIATPWLHDEIVLIAPPMHPLCRQERVRAADLWDHDFVHREPGSGTDRTVQAAFRARGLGLPPGPTMGSIEALKRAVMAGVGLAWISALAVEEECRRAALAPVRVADLPIRRRHRLIHLRQRSLKASASAFLDLLHAETTLS